MSIFIGGHWLWDTDGVLAAYNDEGQLIDDIARLTVKYSDPCICDNDKKLIAYAPEMLKFIRQLANGYRINNWTQVCKEAEKLVKAIDEENGDNKNHE